MAGHRPHLWGPGRGPRARFTHSALIPQPHVRRGRTSRAGANDSTKQSFVWLFQDSKKGRMGQKGLLTYPLLQLAPQVHLMSEQENHMKGCVLLNLQEISSTRHLLSSLHLILSRDPDFQVMVRTVNNMEVSEE